MHQIRELKGNQNPAFLSGFIVFSRKEDPKGFLAQQTIHQNQEIEGGNHPTSEELVFISNKIVSLHQSNRIEHFEKQAETQQNGSLVPKPTCDKTHKGRLAPEIGLVDKNLETQTEGTDECSNEEGLEKVIDAPTVNFPHVENADQPRKAGSNCHSPDVIADLTATSMK